MTLPTGTISMSEVNTELGISPASTQISLNDAAVRTLASVPTGSISLDNLRGKSNVFQLSGGDGTLLINGYRYHWFQTTATFAASGPATDIEFILCAGGGAGGYGPGSSSSGGGGGGGGGGVKVGIFTLVSAASGPSGTMTIGSGGTFSLGVSYNGGPSSITTPTFTLTANGGGAGGFWSPLGGGNNGAGAPGGSGGGSAAYAPSPSVAFPTGAGGGPPEPGWYYPPGPTPFYPREGWTGGGGGRPPGPGQIPPIGSGGGGGGFGNNGTNALNTPPVLGAYGGNGRALAMLLPNFPVGYPYPNTPQFNYKACGGGGQSGYWNPSPTPVASAAWGGGGRGRFPGPLPSVFYNGAVRSGGGGGGGRNGSGGRGGSGFVLIRYLSAN